MSKKITLFSILILFYFCAPKQHEVEKTTEDGVEVVINHIEPYTIEGEPSALFLEEECSIDTENENIAAVGLTDIHKFDVDLEGNIYFLIPPSGQDRFVYKFDEKGNFLTSFGRKGQGPFELEDPQYLKIVHDDEVMVMDPSKNKYFTFSQNGASIEEIPIDRNIDNLILLENGKYLAQYWHTQDREAKYFSLTYNLYDAQFNEIKELDRLEKFPNRMMAEVIAEKIIDGTNYVFVGEASGGNIYIGNCERGYEILVYDLEGNLQRKIRKEYKPVEVSEDYKREYLRPFLESGDAWAISWAEKIYFPKDWHPFYSFLSGDKGRLFVMTHEAGKNAGEYMFDIFNSEGIYTARKSLKYSPGKGRLPDLNIKAKLDRLYCVQVKENGYKKLVAYRMRWE